jgi:cytochrome o ubiquinol oxidase subunit 2
MGRKSKAIVLLLLFAAAGALIFSYFHTHDIAVLSPKGTIGSKERSLIIEATLLMLIVVIPVYIMTFMIAWKYRAGNKKAKYQPDWDRNNMLEFLWWAIPGFIIMVLAVITFRSSHELDPFKQLSSSKPPMTIQVVALDWKWLFIYPQQNIASVNLAEFPAGTPVDFEITSDAPMNSFWIPQLGGQIYAMSGMRTHLHLVADNPGSFRGVSANISGKGFAGMNFIAKSTTEADFNSWVRTVKDKPAKLNSISYAELSKPSQNNPVAYFSSIQAGLYDRIILKFLVPTATHPPNSDVLAAPASDNLTGSGAN